MEGGAGRDVYFIDHVDDEVVELSNGSSGALIPGSRKK